MQELNHTAWHPDWISNRGVLVVFSFILWGALGGSVLTVHAQAGTSPAEALTSQERPVRISIQPAYQRFEDDGRVITQWSAPLVAVVPFRDRWQLSLRGSGASAGGDNLQTLSGFSDVRAALSYAQPVGDGSLIVTANVNAPTGKEKLTPGEFNTARLLSRNLYRFRVPSFGQGFGAGTSLTWAVPVTESVVVGLGGMVRYNGSYTPMVGQQEEYDPGEEARVTGGLDLRLGQGSALSADVSFYLYGTDTVGDVDRFSPGNQISVRVQFLRQGEQNTLRITGQYRNQEKSTLPLRQGETRALQVLPTRALLRGQYVVGLTDAVDLEMSAAGRWYGETTVYESQTVATVGLSPRFAVGEVLTVAPQAAYTAGTITGLEGGIGLSAQF